MNRKPLVFLVLLGCSCLFAGEVFGKTSTTTALISSANPSSYGQSVVLTATVSSSTGTPSGTVTFNDGATALGTSTLNASRVATLTTTTFSIGSHSITAVYNGNANFNGSTSSALSQAVTNGNQTINFTHPGTHTYGAPPFALSATASSGLPVTFSISSGPATLSGNILTITGPGTIKVNASQAGNSNYNAAPTVTRPFTVNGPAALTVSGLAVDNKVYDRTTVATLNTGSAVLIGVVGGDNVTIDISGATASFTDKNVGTAKTVAISGIVLGGTDAGKYTFTAPTSGSADITAATVTGGITAADKVYDENTSATLIATNVSGVLAGDDVSANCASASFSDAQVGSNKTVTATLSLAGADVGNYVLGSSTATTTASIFVSLAPSISICMNPDGCAKVSCAGAPGATFCVQATSCLSPANWTTISTNVLGGDGACVYIDTDATNCPVRFYRTMVAY